MLARGLVEKNPVQFVKSPRKPQTNKQPFEPAEAKRLLEACAPELRPLALCGFYTGLGGRELIRLAWKDVSFARRSISIVRQKTGKLVHISLHPHLEAELRALKEQRARDGRIPSADDRCFVSRYGRPRSRRSTRARTGTARRSSATRTWPRPWSTATRGASA
jgi:integrase